MSHLDLTDPLAAVTLGGMLLLGGRGRWWVFVLCLGFPRPAAPQEPPRLEHTLEAHKKGVGTLHFSHDSRSLASGGGDGVVRFWDPATGRAIGESGKRSDKIEAQEAPLLAYSANGAALASSFWYSFWSTVATGSRRVSQFSYKQVHRSFPAVRVWDLAANRSVPGFQVKAQVTALAISRDGRLLATAEGWPAVLQIWRIATGESLLRRVTGGKIRALAFSPNGRLLAAGGSMKTGPVELLDPDSGATRASAPKELGEVQALDFSPDGASLACASKGAGLSILDPGTARILRRGESSSQGQSVRFSPDGSGVAAAFKDGSVSIFDPASLALKAALSPHSKSAAAVAYSPDGRRLATGGDDGVIRIYALKSAAREPAIAARAPRPVPMQAPMAEPVDIPAQGETETAEPSLVLTDARRKQVAPAEPETAAPQAEPEPPPKASPPPPAPPPAEPEPPPPPPPAPTAETAQTRPPATPDLPQAPPPEVSENPAKEASPVQPPRPIRRQASTPSDGEAFAVVIGVDRYRAKGLPAASNARRDAEEVRAALIAGLGFLPQNVALLRDEEADREGLERHLRTWINNRVTSRSRVLIYFAGAGAGPGFLLPHDGNPARLLETGYPLSRIYDTLAHLPTRRAWVVLDAGVSGSGARAVAARGPRPEPRGPREPGPNTSVLAAGESPAPKGKNKEDRSPLTSALLRGLQGEADADSDGKLLLGEILAFVEKEGGAKRQGLSTDREPWATFQ